MRFCGGSKFICANVASGREGFKMMVCLTDGLCARIEITLLAFTKNDCKYIIKDVQDDGNGAVYRTGSKRWMGTRVILSYAF